MQQLLVSEGRRADSYETLAECYHLPDDELVMTLRDAARRSDVLAGEIIRSLPALGSTDALKVDYSRLFVGPYELLAPPYGSVYLEDNQLMGESTADAGGLYGQEDLHVSLKEAPDHICVELEFMRFLILKGIEAIQNGDRERARSYRHKQRSFLNVHLGAWVADFAERIRANAQTDFYRTLGHLTGTFVRGDLKHLCDGDEEPQEL
ncbi:MAG: TorD/DmsD family molecular chaperone [Planctomycetota bacterium]|jgi:TorA maturation chaperone TorD